jgi:transcription antitermination factor NusG
MINVQTPNPISDDLSWFALHAKATHEKRVASLLTYHGYEWFLPLYRCRRRWSDRIKEVDLPLFPGYVFCRFVSQTRGPLLRIPSVMGIVGIGRTPIAIDPLEIAAIQRVVQSGFGIFPHPFIQVGQRVRIDGGSLNGLEGLIVDVRKRNRLIVSVSLLQRSVAVEIDSAWVTPVPAAAMRTPCVKPPRAAA